MHTTSLNWQQQIRAALTLGLVFFLAASCKKDIKGQPQKPAPTSESEITNTWVIENMRDIYYWNTSMPGDQNLNYELGPEEFFETILHPDDRFSWIQLAEDLEDNLSGVSTTVGLGIGLLQINQGGDVIIS